MTLETITVNRIGKAKYATKDGRQYLVAPMTLIVPGVLAGSQGALYYPPDEIAREHQSWNGVPLVSYHPTAMNGKHLSANDEKVLEKQGIGEFQDGEITSDGKLRGNGWFDVERTKKINNRILTALRSGQPIELSTGLYTDNQPAPAGSHFKGKPYTHIARNYRPDHVAILIDQTGACSIHDGCGVYNQLAINAIDPELLKSMTAARMASLDAKRIQYERGSSALPKYNKEQYLKSHTGEFNRDATPLDHRNVAEAHLELSRKATNEGNDDVSEKHLAAAQAHFDLAYAKARKEHEAEQTTNCNRRCTCGGSCQNKLGDPDCPD